MLKTFIIVSKDSLFVLFSSALLILSFPRFDFGFLAWVGLLPLFIAIRGSPPRNAFLLSWICGFLYFAGVFYWMREVETFGLFHHAILNSYFALYFGLFGLAYGFIQKYSGLMPALFAGPFLWVSLEYIRSNLSFLALPLGLLAHSQHQSPSMIQIASLTGTYSISFLIVLVNTAFAALALPIPRKGKTSLILVAALLTTLTFVYGQLVISKPIVGDAIRISLVQGNIEQTKKWDPRFAREIMDTYIKLTETAMEERPALIIWPETATPGSIGLDPKLYGELQSLAEKTEASLLIGSAPHQKFSEKGKMEVKYYNSAYFINPEPGTQKNKRYDKIRLFPFTEYLPYKDVIPWSLFNVREAAKYVAGNEFTVFKLREHRFAATICWENVFPDLVREFVRRGAQFVINMTNEARFGETAAPYLFASTSVFRAVENRVFIVRCANTGVSCVIDPYGRTIRRVRDDQGQDIFVRGIMSGGIIARDSNTLYTRYGDWFAWMTMIGSALFLVHAGFARRPR